MKLKTIFLLITFFSSILFADLEKSVVRINSTISSYDYKQPWKDAKQKNIIGSGVIIENKYILTAAHVVSNAKVIEIKKSGKNKKYYANVKHISHQADLALLEMYDKRFFEDTKALKIEIESKLEDEISVAGYPFSRNKLLIKKGKISKIEYNSYSFSNEDLLTLKLNVDAKEGNSGGPILNKKGQIIGIAMQIPKESKNIAYAIPSFIINSFLEDIKDSKVDGFHSNSNSYQYLENKTLKEFYNVDKKGFLVTAVDIEEKQLKVDDIILKSGKDKLFLQFHSKAVGEKLQLSIFRKNKILNIDYKLKYSKKLIEQEFNTKPRYFVFGGLVFTPITRNYLQSIGMKEYEMNMLFYQQKRSLDLKERVAWMETKFPLDINKGYTSKVEIVDKVNNIKVKSFEHFISLIQNSKEKYIIIDFLKRQRVVLDKEEALKSFSEIQKQYKVPLDRRF